jgi:hypothetical protein
MILVVASPLCHKQKQFNAKKFSKLTQLVKAEIKLGNVIGAHEHKGNSKSRVRPFADGCFNLIFFGVPMRRFTGLTNGFSKKLENLEHAVAVHYMHYNLCRIQQSFRVIRRQGRRMWSGVNESGICHSKGITKKRQTCSGATDRIEWARIPTTRRVQLKLYHNP